jgi:hypothetical protein
MHESWWDDYKMVPSESNLKEYFAAMGLLQTFDRFGLVEVRPCYRSAPHYDMDIWVDEVYYAEPLSVFVSRFKKV